MLVVMCGTGRFDDLLDRTQLIAREAAITSRATEVSGVGLFGSSKTRLLSHDKASFFFFLISACKGSNLCIAFILLSGLDDLVGVVTQLPATIFVPHHICFWVAC